MNPDAIPKDKIQAGLQVTRRLAAQLGISAESVTMANIPSADRYPESADGERVFEPALDEAPAADHTKKNGTAEILPFETFDASRWEGVPIEPRRWIAHNRIPVGEPGIMSGDGGTGKTKLALQLAVAIPAGLRDWIGGVVDAEGSVIVFSAEEKLKEMHRRTLDVIEYRGLSFSDLHGGLHFICDNDDTVLGAVDRRVSERMCKQVSVSLPYRGDSHDEQLYDYAGIAGSTSC